MDGTILQQGTFSGLATGVTLNLRSDLDYLQVYNYSEWGNANVGEGFQYYWQRGMNANEGLIWYTAQGPVTAVAKASVGIGAGAVGGFTLVDSTNLATALGPALAVTSVSTGNPPVFTIPAANPLLKVGSVVRFAGVTGAPQINGIDFTIFSLGGGGTTFTVSGLPQLAVAGAGGFYRIVNTAPAFYPSNRFIEIVTTGATTTIVTTVANGLTVGQEVRFNIPAAFGMVQLNGLSGTIISILSPFAFLVNIDSSAFTAFVFPTAGAVPFTPAQIIPFGEDTATALVAAPPVNILADATLDTSYIGIFLAGGDASPGGADDDQMFWVAGKSFSVSNNF